MTQTFDKLRDLYDAMKRDDSRILDSHGCWSNDLPTFGGSEPEVAALPRGVWSWDETHLIVGTCADDLRIVPREDRV